MALGIALDSLFVTWSFSIVSTRDPLEIARKIGARYAGDVPADRLRRADRIRRGVVGLPPPARVGGHVKLIR